MRVWSQVVPDTRAHNEQSGPLMRVSSTSSVDTSSDRLTAQSAESESEPSSFSVHEDVEDDFDEPEALDDQRELGASPSGFHPAI